MLCILLHPLQVLLVTFETPGIVFDLRHHVPLLQAEVEHLCLLMLLHLITITTAKATTKDRVSFGCLQELFIKPFVLFLKAPRCQESALTS